MKKNFLGGAKGISIVILAAIMLTGCPGTEINEIYVDSWVPQVPPPVVWGAPPFSQGPGSPEFPDGAFRASITPNPVEGRNSHQHGIPHGPHIWFARDRDGEPIASAGGHGNPAGMGFPADITVNRWQCAHNSADYSDNAAAGAQHCWDYGSGLGSSCDCFWQIRNWRTGSGGRNAVDGNTINGVERRVPSLGHPLIVRFTASFDTAEFIKMGSYTFAADGTTITAVVDPLLHMYRRLPTQGTGGATGNQGRVALDFSEATWTGMIPGFGPASMTSAPGYGGGARTGTGNTNLVGIRLPRTLYILPAQVFRSSTGLQHVSFRDSAVTMLLYSSLRTAAPLFYDFTGANYLEAFGNSALRDNASSRTWTHRSTDVTVIAANNTANPALDFSNLPSLIGFQDESNRNINANELHFRINDHLFFGQHALQNGLSAQNTIQRVFLYGYSMIDAAWLGFPARNVGGTAAAFPPIMRFENWNGYIGTFTGFVQEVYINQQLSNRRPFRGMFQLSDDDGVGHGQEQIHVHPELGDIYRGQQNMFIQARVHGAPGGEVPIFSRPDNDPRYRVGTMNNGWITLNPLDVDDHNLAELNPVSGMEITFNPNEFNTTRHGALTGSTTDRGMSRIEGVPYEYTINVAGAARPRWHWEPAIGRLTSPGHWFGYGDDQPQFIAVMSFFYQDSAGNWHEIKRTGNDTFVDEANHQRQRWWTDRRDMKYVWVDRDVTIRRIHRRSGGVAMGDMWHHGFVPITQQWYFMLGHPEMHDPNRRGQPLAMGFWSVKLSLREGWNQLERLYRFTYEDGSTIWAEIQASVLNSAGVQGPFASFDPGNRTDFTRRSGFAYNRYHPFEGGANTGLRIYTDEFHRIQVPWIHVE